ncbi:hypothetical protein GCM10009789_35680 [Kribbella sancticallisti]|uniref:SnoaL-like domain-containing protein n=1 Tax=Kribbella sancticallisti TaxID=460087 RepID=A0ABN2DMB8_9ACTN
MDTRHSETDPAGVVRRFFAEQDAGNLAIIDELVTDNFRLHVAGVPGPLDKAGLRAFAESFYSAFPDLRHNFLRQIVSDQLVASHVRLRGTHQASFQGIAAAGADIDVIAMQFTYVEGDRIAEHWTVVDQLTLLGQLGALGADHRKHPHHALFAELYDAFTAGDMEAVAAMFAPDIIWHAPGAHPLAGTFHGRADTIASFVREFDVTAGTYKPSIRDVLVSEIHIVALLHASAQRDHRTLDEDYTIIFRIKDGLIAEAWETWQNQRLADAFWSA